MNKYRMIDVVKDVKRLALQISKHYLPGMHLLFGESKFSELHADGNNSRHIGKSKLVTSRPVIYEDKFLPPHISVPVYYKDGFKEETVPKEIEIKNNRQISGMRRSCKLAKEVLDEIEKLVTIGITTEQLDDFAYKFIISKNAYPSPLNFQGFPKSICTSVNNIICHGIPSDRPLEDGDIISVDVSVYFEGFHGDCARTFLVGNVDKVGVNLVSGSKHILERAISVCKHGVPFSDIGKTIEHEAENCSLKLIPCITGHGIGSYFHGLPQICHYYNGECDEIMKSGMTFTIEPAFSQSSHMACILNDEWSVATADDSRAAQFEHTILVTSSRAEILTA